MYSSPRLHPTVVTGSPRNSPRILPVREPSPNNGGGENPENLKKSTIRVDAFLGEWLTPDYFELITPPPSSVMMVAGAKADLLRREDYSYLTNSRDSHNSPSNQGFPGGWGSPVVAPKEDQEKDEGGLPDLSALSHALPRRDRTSSLSSAESSGNRQRCASPLPTPGEHGKYQPPIPNYAISSSEPIPIGYVAHARDACVDVDYQWDSMREPQDWGTGGEYGEEWSSMHIRFRTGLQKLIGWYRNSDDPGKVLPKLPSATSHASNVLDDHSEDEDTDLVIILVTHGAGCNALIGALTNHPVLMDVGMASLTMAIRKSTPPKTPSTPPQSRPNSKILSISDQYDVPLIANTEHLRTPSTSIPNGSRPQALAGLSVFREKFTLSGSYDPSPFSRSRPITTNSSLGSIRRTASIANSAPRSFAPIRQNSIGLWTPRAQEEEATEDAEDDIILNFGDDSGVRPKGVNIDEIAIDDDLHDKEEDAVAPLGLWGSPRPPGQAETIREMGTKRRWTVHERG